MYRLKVTDDKNMAVSNGKYYSKEHMISEMRQELEELRLKVSEKTTQIESLEAEIQKHHNATDHLMSMVGSQNE